MDDLLQLKLHKINTGGAGLCMKLDSAFIKVCKDTAKNDPVISENTEFDAIQGLVLYVEGRKVTEVDKGQKVMLQVKSGATNWADGDAITLHVARSVIAGFRDGGTGKGALDTFLVANKKDSRTDPEFVQVQSVNKYWLKWV